MILIITLTTKWQANWKFTEGKQWNNKATEKTMRERRTKYDKVQSLNINKQEYDKLDMKTDD